MDEPKRTERVCAPCGVRWHHAAGPDCWVCGEAGRPVEAHPFYTSQSYNHRHTGEAYPA